jgi:hypothetical protein
MSTSRISMRSIRAIQPSLPFSATIAQEIETYGRIHSFALAGAVAVQ